MIFNINSTCGHTGSLLVITMTVGRPSTRPGLLPPRRNFTIRVTSGCHVGLPQCGCPQTGSTMRVWHVCGQRIRCSRWHYHRQRNYYPGHVFYWT